MKAPSYTGMATTLIRPDVRDDNALGRFLKDCRARLDPSEFGIRSTRRRTPGLRREEVAQRADVSATWYTWLEQGRGGVPSADVLDRIAHALALTPVEREHLFLLAQRRPPEVRYDATTTVSERLQRVLDGMELMPAIIRTSTWDVLAWNRAAVAVFGDYSQLPPAERNLLRLIFTSKYVRAQSEHWESYARLAVAAVRADAARAGAWNELQILVDELAAASPAFAAIWNENEVREHGEGTKKIEHPAVGVIALDYSSLAVDGQPNLQMVIFSPAGPEDRDRIRRLLSPT
ncbi:MAG TPA: helix-turn-helix transcriptional regulator [Candidatus Aquilonibacter sp.]|nr:helix-turn-helix transcriptional regulator [Candidatus Aquilonibacter sp.]